MCSICSHFKMYVCTSGLSLSFHTVWCYDKCPILICAVPSIPGYKTSLCKLHHFRSYAFFYITLLTTLSPPLYAIEMKTGPSFAPSVVPTIIPTRGPAFPTGQPTGQVPYRTVPYRTIPFMHSHAPPVTGARMHTPLFSTLYDFC